MIPISVIIYISFPLNTNDKTDLKKKTETSGTLPVVSQNLANCFIHLILFPYL